MFSDTWLSEEPDTRELHRAHLDPKACKPEERDTLRYWNRLFRTSETPERALMVWDSLFAEAIGGNVQAMKVYLERLAGPADGKTATRQDDEEGGGNWLDQAMLSVENTRLSNQVAELQAKIEAMGGSGYVADQMRDLDDEEGEE